MSLPNAFDGEDESDLHISPAAAESGPGMIEIPFEELRFTRNVVVQGNAPLRFRISDAGYQSLSKGTAKLHIATNDRASDLLVEIGDFRGVVRVGFKGKTASVKIGMCRQINADLLLYNDSHVVIGNLTSINEASIVIEDSRVDIGEDCMFSHGVVLQPCDQHGIISLADRAIINTKRNIKLGRHVWMGKGSYVCPGVTIGDGAIVGMGAVVSKDVPPCSIVVGNPARVVREGVTWSRQLSAIDNPTANFIKDIFEV